ncbi:MAG: hypothetical protein JOZ40_03930 [Methylobacteriaceae bacterium]|nr:hypothetical protein [Methylobacteriaceae bacterium]
MLIAPTPVVLEEPFSSSDRDVVDVDAVIRFIRRGARLCFKWVFLSVCVGFAFTKLSPSYYTATATLLLEDRALRPAAEPGGGAIPIDPTYADSQIQVLQSDEVVGHVLDEMRLAEVEEFGTGGSGIGAFIARLAPSPSFTPGATTSRQAVIMRVLGALSVRRLGLSNAVEIGFTSRDPLRAAAIANAIAQDYINGQVALKRNSAEEAATRLRESLSEIRDKAFAIELPAAGSLLTTPEAGAQAQARNRELQNKAETYRLLYNSLLQRSYMESIDQFSYSGARVITPAEAPAQRSSPRTILALVIAGAVGAVGGMGHALLRQATDRSLRTVEDVQRSIGFGRVIGVRKIRRRAWRAGKPRRKDLQRAYVTDSERFSHAMAKLAVALQAGRPRQSGQVIGVAAPMPGTGASSVAIHFAKVIAEAGQNTLLIDANWGKSSFAPDAQDENPAPKLASALSTIRIESESLDVLTLRPAGPISELNASLSILTALQQLRARYDCVVIDFHSTEQTVDLEASMSALNEVIVVVESGRTLADTLRAFLRFIPKEKVMGVVLNKV